MAKKLGKGLGEIFGDNIDSVLDEISKGASDVKGDKLLISVSEIRPNPYQPRKLFDEEALKDLSASIKEKGVFTPILVRKSLKGYELIAGERRLKASKMAGLKEIPAMVVDFDDANMMEVSLLENVQRENLTPIFIIGGVYNIKNPFFENRLRVSKNNLDIDIILNTIDIDKEVKNNTVVGYIGNIFNNSKEIEEELKTKSISEVFDYLSEEVNKYYGK